MKRMKRAAKTIQSYFKKIILSNYFKKLKIASSIIQFYYRIHYIKRSIIKERLSEFINENHNLEETYKESLNSLFFEHIQNFIHFPKKKNH